ncbi:hypothetical protein BDW22DRAFT_1361873 [Trametopsis cervina]|nr:hypothetical protein BDW22DRAFT_1361873 [Trametopsis cervina]
MAKGKLSAVWPLILAWGPRPNQLAVLQGLKAVLKSMTHNFNPRFDLHRRIRASGLQALVCRRCVCLTVRQAAGAYCGSCSEGRKTALAGIRTVGEFHNVRTLDDYAAPSHPLAYPVDVL